MIINDSIYGHAYGFSGSLDVRQTATSIVVSRVNQGDTVFVRTASDGACGQTGAFYGDTWRRSAFAGWLLGYKNNKNNQSLLFHFHNITFQTKKKQNLEKDTFLPIDLNPFCMKTTHAIK